MKVLITGAFGFIGKNLRLWLAESARGYELLCADIDTSDAELRGYLAECDAVVHLAGVNRPKNAGEFMTGNADFTQYVLGILEARGGVPFVMTSSIQAALDNDYGKSKLAAEKSVFAYAEKTGAKAYVFRLPNVFGKWCRPNYNSAVATFCHNIANELPIQVNDPERLMTLVYIDDVAKAVTDALEGSLKPADDGYCCVPVTYDIKLQAIADKIYSFHECKKTKVMPPFESALDRDLYATYLSYLPADGFGYELEKHADDRGMFAELLKCENAGQVSISTTAPGVTRGNHWHHTKTEKFIIVSGEATLRFRKLGEGDVIEYTVSGDAPQVVDIPPGYTHSITNISDDKELITVIWASEIYDPAEPDTYFQEV